MLAAGGYHDLGGQSDSTPLVFSAPPYEHWELQVSGMVSLLVRTGRLTIYELRRGIEGLPPAVAASATYYEKWTLSTITMLLERGIISTAEWDEAIGRPLAAPPLSVGDHVVVRSEDAANRFRKPHIRTPGYIFGCAGEVIACMGSFEDPELAAFRWVRPSHGA